MRNLIFRIHKWLGLHLALFFILMFATGMLLLVADELEAIVYPNIWASASETGENVSFGEIYGSVLQDFPHGQIAEIKRQPQPWLADRSTVTTGWGEKVVVWTDPATAQVLEITTATNFRTVLHSLHDSLLIPRRIAFVLVASTSLLLLATLLAGLITYRRFWKGFLRWPSKSSTGRARKAALHRVFAVWSVVFLLITGVSGTYFMLTGLGFNGYTPQPGAAITRPAVIPDGFDSATIKRAENVVSAVADFRPTKLTLPGSISEGLKFSGFSGGFGHLTGTTTLAVDPVNMQILGNIGPAQFRGNARLEQPMVALHFGQWGEPYSRVLWFVFGLMSIYLVIAGLNVAVSRRQTETAGSPDHGFIRILGVFKWAYLGLILAIIAVGVLQYGPTSEKWTTVPQAANADPSVKLQIFGTLRAGETAEFRAITQDDQITALNIQTHQSHRQFPIKAGQPRIVTRFDTIGEEHGNEVTIEIIRQNGDQTSVTYNLGATIW